MKPSSPPHTADAHRFVVPALVYAALVAYGSLLPFDYTPRAFADAVAAFRALEFLQLGMLDRADWIANGVLFAPLGALIYASFAGTRRCIPCALIALPICGLVAGTLEFAQLYFPPRTVSINDWLSETFGSAAGILFWMAGAQALMKAVSHLRTGGRATLRAMLWIYALLYFGLSFFPYDFVVGLREFSVVNAGRPSWLSIGQYCAGGFDCTQRLAVEVLASIPLGMAVAGLLGQSSLTRVMTTAIAGAVLGVMIEIGQMFLITGSPNAASIGTRVVGFALGALSLRALDSAMFASLYARRKLLLAVAIIPYFGVVAYANKWLSGAPASLESARAILAKVHFTPFYYHYYSSEAVALTSALLYFALYFPLGAMWALWRGARPCGSGCVALAGLAAAALAGLMEAGKLWFASLPPDPTDVVIGACSAALAAWLAARMLNGESPARGTIAGATEEFKPLRPIAVLAALGAAFIVLRFPYAQAVLLAGVAVYVIVLMRWRHAWLVVAPTALAWPDLAEFSGWFFFDESDLILAVTVAVAYWRYRRPTETPRVRGIVPFALLTVAYLVSVLVGLTPFAPFDAAAFSDYRSPYNAFRIGKAMLWAILLMPLLRVAIADHAPVKRLFALGVSVGVLGVGVIAVRERLLFSGLFDLHTDFRITVFSAMHIGSGVLDGYLVLALPLAAYLVARGRHWLEKAIGSLALALGLYTLVATFSRGAQLAFAVTAGILLLGHLLRVTKMRYAGPMLVSALVIVIVAGAFAPLMQKRFAQSGSDLARRISHWHDVAGIANPGWQAAAFGHGVGAFPRIWAFAKAPTSLPANYRFTYDSGNGFLRLGPGDAFYIEQRVPVSAGIYRIEFDARSLAPNALLATPLCEKSVLYSRDCAWDQTVLNRPIGTWQRYGNSIDFGRLGETRFGQRPIKFTLHLARADAPVDIDNVRLLDARGNNLIVNGDFERGSDRWFFTVDSFLAWHAENIFVHTWFEQGWLGVLAWIAWLAWAISRMVKRSLQGEQFALAVLAGLCGFLVVGLFSSLLDAPRLTLLLFCALMVAVMFRWPETPLRH